MNPKEMTFEKFVESFNKLIEAPVLDQHAALFIVLYGIINGWINIEDKGDNQLFTIKDLMSTCKIKGEISV